MLVGSSDDEPWMYDPRYAIHPQSKIGKRYIRAIERGEAKPNEWLYRAGILEEDEDDSLECTCSGTDDLPETEESNRGGIEDRPSTNARSEPQEDDQPTWMGGERTEGARSSY